MDIFIFSYDGLASEHEKTLDESKPGNVLKIVCPPDISEEDLSKIKKMVVLVKSTNPLLGDVAEDQLTIKLRDKGFEVAEASKILELAMDESRKRELKALEEFIEIEKKLDKEKNKAKVLKRLEMQLEKKLSKIEDNSRSEITDFLYVGKKLGLDAIIIGTIFDGRRQTSFVKQNPPTVVEKVIVSTFFLKLIDPKTGKILLTIILEYVKGEDIKNAVDTVSKYLIGSIRGWAIKRKNKSSKKAQAD